MQKHNSHFLSRVDTSLIGQWWWTVDRWNLFALFILIAVGVVLNLAASPPVAERIGFDTFYFSKRQIFFAIMGMIAMMSISLLSPLWIRRLGVFTFFVTIAFMILTLIIGIEVKGATRWIRLPGFSLQASEFIKPSLAIFLAWLLAEKRTNPKFPSYLYSLGVMAMVLSLLLLQPDLGMSIVVCAIGFGQFFFSGIRLWLTACIIMMGMIGIILAYFTMPHVTSRIDKFLHSDSGDNYQISRSIESFQIGGLFGRGPGEGVVKHRLPDAHSDFIFSVAAEEFGMIFCFFLLGLFCFIMLKGVARTLEENNIFIFLAVCGLLIQFGFQTMINIASSLHLMPTKGMTLPFISYGGSSFLAMSLSMGMLLALTRKKAKGSIDPKLDQWSSI